MLLAQISIAALALATPSLRVSSTPRVSLLPRMSSVDTAATLTVQSLRAQPLTALDDIIETLEAELQNKLDATGEGDAHVSQLLAVAHTLTGDYECAEPHARSALESGTACSDAEKAEMHFVIGIAKEQQDVQEEALDAYETALELDPQCWRALFHVGKSQWCRDPFERASPLSSTHAFISLPAVPARFPNPSPRSHTLPLHLVCCHVLCGHPVAYARAQSHCNLVPSNLPSTTLSKCEQSTRRMRPRVRFSIASVKAKRRAMRTRKTLPASEQSRETAWRTDSHERGHRALMLST